MMDREHLEELRELVEFLKANEIAEFDMERSDVTLRIKFAGARRMQTEDELRPQSGTAAYAASSPTIAAAGIPSSGISTSTTHAAAPAAVVSAPAPVEEVFHLVKSPIVGTFYESSAPGAAPFVKIGDQVEAGQVLCIIEAMKLMNEIEADISGELVQRIALTGQPVEYGQPLFAVRPR